LPPITDRRGDPGVPAIPTSRVAHLSGGIAGRALAESCALAGEVDHPMTRRSIGRLCFLEEGILNHCDFPIHTSTLEGINKRTKVIKRTAYAYRDSEHFVLKVRQPTCLCSLFGRRTPGVIVPPRRTP
jgi:hypothetical protein